MKHDTFEKYTQSDLQLPQQALLTAWDCLAAYQDDLVLVGGLAIKLSPILRQMECRDR